MSEPESQTVVELRAVERRRMLRTRVVLSGVVADKIGENAVDCLILDTSADGAKIQFSSWTLQRNSEVYLIDTRNERAHLATVAWADADQAGLAFVRSYSLELTLPPQLEFLRRLVVDAKLRQFRALTRRSVPIEDAARIIGLGENDLERLGMRGLFEEKVALLLHQAKRLFGKRAQHASDQDDRKLPSGSLFHSPRQRE